MLEWMAAVRRVWSQSESLLRFPHVFISLHIFPHCIPLLEYTIFSCVLFKLSVFPNAGWASQYCIQGIPRFFSWSSTHWTDGENLIDCDGVVMAWYPASLDRIVLNKFSKKSLSCKRSCRWRIGAFEQWSMKSMNLHGGSDQCCRCCRCCRCCLSRPFVALFIYSIYIFVAHAHRKSKNSGSWRLRRCLEYLGIWIVTDCGAWRARNIFVCLDS